MLTSELRRKLKIAEYVGMVIAFMGFVLTVNLHIIAEGFRVSRPTLFRVKLEALPHLRWLLLDSDIGDMDVAVPAALYLMFVVCATWRKIAQSYLEAKSLFGINVKKLGAFTLGIGIPMIVADAYVFFNGLMHHSVWGDGDVVPCLALTVLYISLLIGASVELVVLREQFSPAKSEVKS